MKDKKFRVRLKHYSKDKYCIQYTHYRWIPIWWNMIIYMEGIGWHDIHLTLPVAEEFASNFKTYNHVLALFSIQQKKESEYKRKMKEKKEMEVPFKIKEVEIKTE